MKLKDNSKKVVLLLIMVLLLGVFVVGCGEKEDVAKEPEQPVNEEWVPTQIDVVVAHSVGSNMDILTRSFCRIWSEHLGGTNFVFDNKDAASGRVAYDHFQTLSNEGTSILASNVASAAIMYAQQQPDWDWMDTLLPMGVMAIDPGVIIVSKDSKFESFEQLIEEAKGRKLIAAISRWESEETLLLQQIMELTGAQFEIIPFGGAPEVLAALLGGHADFTPRKLSDYQKNVDDMKILSVSMDTNYIPEVTDNAPTNSEVIGEETLTVASYRAFVVHKDLEENYPERYQKLKETFEEAKKDPRFVEEAVKQGFHPDLIVDLGPDEINTVIKQSWDAYEKYKEFYTAAK